MTMNDYERHVTYRGESILATEIKAHIWICTGIIVGAIFYVANRK